MPPPSAFGRAAASPQTRQMRCWLSAAQAAYHSFPSLPPTKTRSLRCTAFFPPKPLRGVSAGALLGAVIKTPMLYFLHFCVGGITTLRPLCLCRNNSAQGLFQQKKRLSQSGCSVPTNALFPPAHSAFSAFLHGGGITTLGVRFMLSKRWTPAGHGGLFAVFMPSRNLPRAGRISPRWVHTTTPSPNRAHSGSHAETRRVLRVDGDDVFGSGIIDTIGPFQADQPISVALAEEHRNAVSP